MRTHVPFAICLFSLGAVLTGTSIVLAVALSEPATATPASSVSCGDILLADTTLTSDLIDCTALIALGMYDNITLDCDGHTIDGVGMTNYGIGLGSGDTVRNCVVTDFAAGIVSNGPNNIVTGNTVSSNAWGIYLGGDANNNTISHNTLTNNWLAGIEMLEGENPYNNNISNNAIRNGENYGIHAAGTDNALNSNVVCSNLLDFTDSGSNYGDDNSCLSTSNWNDTGTQGCTFSCPVEPVCDCSNCSECNDRLSDDCPVVKLTADIVNQSGTCISQARTFNGEVFDCQGHTIDGGISLWGRAWNTIKNCVFTDDGIYLDVSHDNLIYNNYLEGARDNMSNTWNIAKTPGVNIIGGPYLGGNYWSDYTGVDTDDDGLGDTNLPYNVGGIIENGGDYAPLVPASGPVGGIAELPNVAQGSTTEADSKDDGSRASTPPYAALAGAAAVLLALTAGAWYARRRWGR